jgi:biotin carboxyl carrier protein
MGANVVKLTLVHANREYAVEISSDGRVRVDDRTFDAVREGNDTVRIGGETAWIAAQNGVRWVFWNGVAYEITERRARGDRRGGAGRHRGDLSAPMPATVRRILVAPGDVVKAGDTLLILEAMKMELPVRAATAGTVRAVSCREGELVQPGVPLVEMA